MFPVVRAGRKCGRVGWRVVWMGLKSLGRPWYGLLLSVDLMAEMLKEHALTVLCCWSGHTRSSVAVF